MRASTALHEASHVTAALLLGRPVDWVRVEIGNTWDDEPLASAMIPLRGGTFEPDDVVIRVVGYMSEERWQGWPPPFQHAKYETLEDLDDVIAACNLDAEQYDQLVEQAEAMLADRRFLRLRNAIARLLTITPRLERHELERLAHAHGCPTPQLEQEHACST